MHHIFRINVAGQGYVLYAGSARQGFAPQDLGLASPAVPAGYLKAQQRLDEAFEQRRAAWSVAMNRAATEAGAVLAYGGWLALPDEFDRPGVAFIHGLVLGDVDSLPACTASVLARLSAQHAGELMQDLRGLARGQDELDLQEFMKRTAEAVETLARQIQHAGQGPMRERLPKLGSIEHDCAGAAPLAWLKLAAQQTQAVPPWEVFDRIGSNANTETCVHPAAGERMSAARLLLHDEVRTPNEAPVEKEILPATASLSVQSNGSDSRRLGHTITLPPPPRPFAPARLWAAGAGVLLLSTGWLLIVTSQQAAQIRSHGATTVETEAQVASTKDRLEEALARVASEKERADTGAAEARGEKAKLDLELAQAKSDKAKLYLALDLAKSERDTAYRNEALAKERIKNLTQKAQRDLDDALSKAQSALQLAHAAKTRAEDALKNSADELMTEKLRALIEEIVATNTVSDLRSQLDTLVTREGEFKTNLDKAKAAQEGADARSAVLDQGVQALRLLEGRQTNEALVAVRSIRDRIAKLTPPPAASFFFQELADRATKLAAKERSKKAEDLLDICVLLQKQARGQEAPSPARATLYWLQKKPEQVGDELLALSKHYKESLPAIPGEVLVVGSEWLAKNGKKEDALAFIKLFLAGVDQAGGQALDDATKKKISGIIDPIALVNILESLITSSNGKDSSVRQLPLLAWKLDIQSDRTIEQRKKDGKTARDSSFILDIQRYLEVRKDEPKFHFRICVGCLDALHLGATELKTQEDAAASAGRQLCSELASLLMDKRTYLQSTKADTWANWVVEELSNDVVALKTKEKIKEMIGK